MITRKNQFIFVTLFLAFPASIITSPSYSKSSVENKVNGGDIYSRIEVEVNGEKKALETSESGKHELMLEKEGSTSEVKSETSTNKDDEDIEYKKEGGEGASESREAMKENFRASFFGKVVNLLKDFFTNLLTR